MQEFLGILQTLLLSLRRARQWLIPGCSLAELASRAPGHPGLPPPSRAAPQGSSSSAGPGRPFPAVLF